MCSRRINKADILLRGISSLTINVVAWLWRRMLFSQCGPAVSSWLSAPVMSCLFSQLWLVLAISVASWQPVSGWQQSMLCRHCVCDIVSPCIIMA